MVWIFIVMLLVLCLMGLKRGLGSGLVHGLLSQQLFSMKHSWRLIPLFLAVVLSVSFIPGLAGAKAVFATAAVYYVSPAGNDANVGTITLPFQTFAKAVSMLHPGDTLMAYGGTYLSRLTIGSSGLAGQPLTIEAIAGQHPVIDMKYTSDNPISVTGSYVTVDGFEVKNSSGYCVNLQGQYNILRHSLVHDCSAMGIFTDGQHNIIDSNTVYHASTINSGFAMSSGWGSGIKVRIGGIDITIRNNIVYNNYGEGIAVTRGTYSRVTGNVVYDNYSVNIYIDNSHHIIVDKNLTLDHPNSGFERNGNPSEGIALGEEFYNGWGAQLSNITIQNNISTFTNHGITFFGNNSGSTNGGLKNSILAFNTLWGSTHSEINLAYDSGQTGDIIVDNIIGQPQNNLIILSNPAGIGLSHNFWVNALPPTYARGSGDLSGSIQFSGTPGYTADSYRLATTSPAIGAGISVAGVIDDFSGKLRGPGYDMGAFQVGTQSSTSSPTPVPTQKALIASPTLILSSATPVPTQKALIASPTPILSSPTPVLTQKTLIPSPSPLPTTTVAPKATATPSTVTGLKVSIISPVNGVKVSGKIFTLNVVAQDSVSIVRLQIYQNGESVRNVSESTTSLSYTTDLKISKLSTGANVIKVVVADALNNSIFAEITIYK